MRKLRRDFSLNRDKNILGAVNGRNNYCKKNEISLKAIGRLFDKEHAKYMWKIERDFVPKRDRKNLGALIKENATTFIPIGRILDRETCKSVENAAGFISGAREEKSGSCSQCKKLLLRE